MSVSLLILCLAAFALVAALISGATAAAMPWLDRMALVVTPRHRVRLWLAVAALPSAVALLALLVSFLPAIGFGHDHCLAHGPHHPHLCPNHVGGAPGIVLVAVAVLVALRMARVGVELARSLLLQSRTSRALAEASDNRGGALVFPSDQPQAFVLGALRPRVHVSSGLLALGRNVAEPALAHERVHAAHRDLLWRALCPMLAVGHLPGVAAAIRSRLSRAQEMAADVEAAGVLRDGRVRVAEALVALSSVPRRPSPGLSFTDGDLEARVRALLEDRSAPPTWPVRVLLFVAILVPAAVGLGHDVVHHALETLLGTLS